MLKGKRSLMPGVTMGVITLMATPAFSGSINLRDAGFPLWIFIITGGVIVLFQLIPAAILFFSFIGTLSLIFFKIKKVLEELPVKEKVVVPGYEPKTILKKRKISEKYKI